MRLRYVLDTSVLVAGLRSDRGASRLLLEATLEEQFDVLLSVPLMLEYEAVLNRSENLAAFGISSDEVRQILDELARIGVPIKLAYRLRPRLRDANDDMILETAVKGGADAIITFNVADFRGIASQLECEVLLPREALVRLRGGRK